MKKYKALLSNTKVIQCEAQDDHSAFIELSKNAKPAFILRMYRFNKKGQWTITKTEKK